MTNKDVEKIDESYCFACRLKNVIDLAVFLKEREKKCMACPYYDNMKEYMKANPIG